MFVSVNTPGLGAVPPLGYGYARPHYRGLGQTGCAGTVCADGSVMDDSCICGGSSVAPSGILAGVSTCFNTATGAAVTCPTSGNVQTTPPAAVGPLGLPSSLTADMPWILAGIAAILVIGFIAKG